MTVFFGREEEKGRREREGKTKRGWMVGTRVQIGKDENKGEQVIVINNDNEVMEKRKRRKRFDDLVRIN